MENTNMITLLINLLIGYAIAVIFPFPWLSSYILSLWQKVGTWIASLKNNVVPTPVPTPTPTPVASSEKE